jgi:hypothetical protein
MQGFARLFWILAGFFALAAIVYSVWAYQYDAQRLATDPSRGEGSTTIEWVGTIGLALCGALSLLLAFYLRRSFESQGGELPEDRLDADIDDGAGEQGHFSPWSWWPIILAASAMLVFLGIAVGIWIALIGAGLAIIALVGWVYEYYRGYFAH